MKRFIIIYSVAGILLAAGPATAAFYYVELGATDTYSIDGGDPVTITGSTAITLANWGEWEPDPWNYGNYGGFGNTTPLGDNYVSPTTATADHECRMVWGKDDSGDTTDYADVIFPLAVSSVTLRHLNGGSNDSFSVYVGDGSEEGWVLWGSYDATAASKTYTEEWFETTFTGTAGTVVRIDCTAAAGPYKSGWGQLGIDRITAVPEPATLLLLGLGGLLLPKIKRV